MQRKYLPIVLVLLVLLSLLVYGTASAPGSNPFIKDEPAATTTPPVLTDFITVMDGCDTSFSGECVTARSGPGKDFRAVAQLRRGMVLKVGSTTEIEGVTWYQIAFDEWLRYPGRVATGWFVPSGEVSVHKEIAEEVLPQAPLATSTKYILVDRSDQTLTAFDGDTVFMEVSISTGLQLTPTPRGTFTVYKKTPSRYMQGPLPGISDQYYDLPGVPWNLYFTYQGGVIHGAYWHESFGKPWSHGCVNLRTVEAEELYRWAPIGTKVIVRD